MLKLEILTKDKELATICELYWEIDAQLNFVHTLSEVSQLANIPKTKITATVREASHAYMYDWNCSNCGKPVAFSGRSEFTQYQSYLLNGSYRELSFLCGDCEAKKKLEEKELKRQQEEIARIAREADDNEIRAKIREMYALSDRRKPTNIQALTLTETVYLLCMLRGGAYEDLTKIMPVGMFEQPLSANQDFSTEIINHLYASGLIYVDPENDPDSFVNRDPSRFYIYRVYYAPPISLAAPNDPKALVVELFNRLDGEWSEEWCQEAFQIWRRVALSECKQFLLFCLEEHHFEFSPGEKTTQYLEFALEHFSTAQVFNTIWRAARDAAAYYQREGVPKRQAANATVAAIQRYTERAIAENWDLKPYKRNYKTPQAIISEVLYNLALKLGEEGFTTIPNIEAIRGKKLNSSIPGGH
jgi:hypothetical protein